VNATQKKKLAGLILERLRSGVPTHSTILRRTETVDLQFLGLIVEALASKGFEPVVRSRSRQGKRSYNRRRKPHERAGEARFKYDPAPKDKEGKVHFNLLTCCRYFEPNDERYWKQIWVSLDKETALKMLVLGFLPETIGQS
jgi:hypothetical protein